MTNLAIAVADLAGVSLLVLLQFQIAPVHDRRTSEAWVWLSEASRRKLESHLPEASDRLKGAQKLLTGQKVIRSCGTDKPKWRQNCSIGALRQSLEPPYLWFLEGLRYLLTLWANYNKHYHNWKTSGKVN